ncbi:MAG: S9 family peptidase [Prevotella sp.]|nr:S9 family peptidase [Prevotella sp.]MCM1075575.1 S9 family peptidase [Ruminococcus sp.]
MKRIVLLISGLSILGAGAMTAQSLTPTDYCDITVNTPKSVKEMKPMADGENYLCIAEGGKAIDKYSYKTGKKVETLFDVNAIKGDVKINEFDGYEISDNGRMLLLWNDSEGIYRYSFKAQYYVYDIMRGTMQKVSRNAGKQRGAVLSHDGTMVAFMRDNNLFITNLDFDNEVQITKDGAEGKIINGTPDWGYEEEFGILNTMRWAPDDSSLSYVTFNESEVPVYHFDIYSGYCDPIEEYAKYPGEYTYKYPLAGDNNSVVKVSTYHIDSRLTKVMDIPMAETDYVPSMEYGGSADRLMVMVLNRDQNNLKLYAVNPKSTVAKMILEETSQAWLSPAAYQMVDYSSNSFIIGSDRSGYRHLYQYDYSGKQLRQLTSGKFYVTDYYGYSPTTKQYFFQTTSEGPGQRNIATVNAAGNFKLLNPGKGWESAAFSANCQYYVRTYSNAVTPTQYSLHSLKGKITDLELNKDYAAKYAGAPQKEFLTVPNAQGEMMNAYIIKPANFDASKKYPILMYQYNGPESQEVRNRWTMDGLYYIASQGYVIACVDGRGTGFRSRQWSDCVYKHLGEFETADQIAAAQYFKSLPYIDSERMACFGWSYGGYMTLMELTDPTCPFKAGVSMAPVTDWRFYDSIYTERYMLTPQQNEAGYNIASALDRTSNLKSKLLIMSGTSDDNVHFYNTLKYTAKLTHEGKLFDMVAWTNFEHSLRMCNARVMLYSKVLDFLNIRL